MYALNDMRSKESTMPNIARLAALHRMNPRSSRPEWRVEMEMQARMKRNADAFAAMLLKRGLVPQGTRRRLEGGVIKSNMGRVENTPGSERVVVHRQVSFKLEPMPGYEIEHISSAELVRVTDANPKDPEGEFSCQVVYRRIPA